MTLKERLQKLKAKMQNDVKNKDAGINIGRKPISTAKYPDISFFDPKSGVKIKEGVYTCNIDIIPWVVQSDKHPAQEIRRGDLADKLLLLVHRGVGPANDHIICPRTIGKNCPICEEKNRLKDEGKEKEADKRTPSWRVIYNVIDLNNPDKGIQLFITSRKNFDVALMAEIDIAEKKLGTKIDMVSYHIEFRSTIEMWGKRKYFEFSNFEFEEKEEELTEELVNKAYPLEEMAVYLSYKDIETLFYNKEEEKKEKTSMTLPDESDRKQRKKAEEEDEAKEAPSDDKTNFADMNLPKLRKYVRENFPEVDVKDYPTKNDLIKLIDGELNTDEDVSQIGCSFGHEFGVDTDEYDDCANCSVWNQCIDAFEKKK